MTKFREIENQFDNEIIALAYAGLNGYSDAWEELWQRDKALVLAVHMKGDQVNTLELKRLFSLSRAYKELETVREVGRELLTDSMAETQFWGADPSHIPLSEPSDLHDFLVERGLHRATEFILEDQWDDYCAVDEEEYEASCQFQM